jgi:endonuclease YncB( thermonuclease family)
MTQLIKSLLVVFLLSASLLHAEVLSGKVVGVSDGDTITLLDSSQTQHKIRLTGIDAPEKAQAFGQASKKSLSDLVFSKEVEISWEKRDRYRRILGKVLLNEQDICLEQVKRGMAWHYKQYQRDQPPEDRIKYSRAEEEARKSRIGLWADEAPVPPSEFRHKK